MKWMLQSIGSVLSLAVIYGVFSIITNLTFGVVNVSAEYGCPQGLQPGSLLQDSYVEGGRVDKGKCYRNCKPTSDSTVFYDCKVTPQTFQEQNTNIQCPAGATSGKVSERQDITKCYFCSGPYGVDGGTCPGYDYPQDNSVCPAGTQRGIGGLPGNNDKRPSNTDKCYFCKKKTGSDPYNTTGVNGYDCEEAGYAAPPGTELCGLNAAGQADQSCFNRGDQDGKDYLKAIQAAAPTKDYNIFRQHVPGSRYAQEFCNYYDTKEEDRYDYRLVRQACIYGYELGFGQNMICSDRFLGISAGKPQSEFPTVYSGYLYRYLAELKPYNNEVHKGNSPADSSAIGIVRYDPGNYHPNTQKLTNRLRDLIKGYVVSACHDGYTQYKVDYNFCNGDTSCQNSLRTDSRNVFDPGPPPGRLQDDSAGNPGSGSTKQVLYPADGQQCGGIDTAYFTCGLGDSLETSGIWSVVTIILNIVVSLITILAVGGIVWGALRYASSQDNAGQQQEALTFIRNVVIGLVLFLLMWSIMQYIIPGGIFR